MLSSLLHWLLVLNFATPATDDPYSLLDSWSNADIRQEMWGMSRMIRIRERETAFMQSLSVIPPPPPLSWEAAYMVSLAIIPITPQDPVPIMTPDDFLDLIPLSILPFSLGTSVNETFTTCLTLGAATDSTAIEAISLVFSGNACPSSFINIGPFEESYNRKWQEPICATVQILLACLVLAYWLAWISEHPWLVALYRFFKFESQVIVRFTCLARLCNTILANAKPSAPFYLPSFLAGLVKHAIAYNEPCVVMTNSQMDTCEVCPSTSPVSCDNLLRLADAVYLEDDMVAPELIACSEKPFVNSGSATTPVSPKASALMTPKLSLTPKASASPNFTFPATFYIAAASSPLISTVATSTDALTAPNRTRSNLTLAAPSPPLGANPTSAETPFPPVDSNEAHLHHLAIRRALLASVNPMIAPQPMTAMAGIVESPSGSQHVPESTRADGTMRATIRIRPGYRGPETFPIYRPYGARQASASEPSASTVLGPGFVQNSAPFVPQSAAEKPIDSSSAAPESSAGEDGFTFVKRGRGANRTQADFTGLRGRAVQRRRHKK